LLSVLAAVVALAACATPKSIAQPIPAAPPTATPCGQSCGPIAGPSEGAQPVQTATFALNYYTPWTLQSHDDDGVVLSYTTDFGKVVLSLKSTAVADGTTADALLTSWLKQNIDPTKYQGINDYGIVHGAEIGYVPGAGHVYRANLVLPNAPSAPIFLEVMVVTRGTTGYILVVVSPLDPHSPNPGDKRQVRNVRYDLIANSVRWL
jgi:hypothetical protein